MHTKGMLIDLGSSKQTLQRMMELDIDISDETVEIKTEHFLYLLRMESICRGYMRNDVHEDRAMEVKSRENLRTLKEIDTIMRNKQNIKTKHKRIRKILNENDI